MYINIRKYLVLQTLLLLIAVQVYSVSLDYSMQTDGGEILWTTWEISEEQDYLEFIQTDSDGVKHFISDFGGSVQQMVFQNPGNQELLSGERIQNLIFIESPEGSVNVKLSPDGYWYQPLGPSLFEFILSSEQKRSFSIIDLESLKGHSMVIRKKGEEEISIMGRMRSAVRAELRMGGVLSPFWSGQYWFSKETGILLRYVGDSGPGTPEMVMELGGEEGDIRSIRGFSYPVGN